MLVLNGVALGVCLVGPAQAVQMVFRCSHRCAFIDDLRRVDRSADLRHPRPDVLTLRIVVLRLLGWRMDAQGVDAAGARLCICIRLQWMPSSKSRN